MILLYAKIMFWLMVAGVVLNVVDMLKGLNECDGRIFAKGLISAIFTAPFAMWVFQQIWGGK